MITQHPFTGSPDLLRLVGLQKKSTSLEQQDDLAALHKLEHQLSAPSLDRTRDLSLWEDQHQHLVGFGKLSNISSGDPFDIFLGIMLHPHIDTRNVSAKIIAWAEVRAREIAQLRSSHAMLCMRVEEDDAEQRSLLECHGFSIRRQFLTMEYSLCSPLPPPVFPSSFELCLVDRERDAEACVEIYNESFGDHWNHHLLTIEQLKYDFNDPNYRDDLNVAIKNENGLFVAFGYGIIDQEENKRTQRKVGWMLVGGTRQEYRKQGIFRSILHYGLYQMQKAGMEIACLHVDAQHKAGLPMIYESEGFQRVGSYFTYGKPL